MRVVKYSKSEELLNILTHLFGFVLSLICFLPVIIKSYMEKNTTKFVAWLIYFISIEMMFLSSLLYHSITNPTARTIFRAIDHGVIYLTIAGSYAPVCLIGVNSKFSIAIFVLVWILAIAGIIMNIVAFSTHNEDKIAKPSMVIYMVMGWISLIIIYQIYRDIGLSYLMYIFLGGVFYTVGAVFYKIKKIPYNHAIWHIFILVAAFTMFYGNYLYLS